MPIGPYSKFSDCVKAQMKKGHDKLSAEKICGSIEAKVKAAHKKGK
jgi:hypothetical protein